MDVAEYLRMDHRCILKYFSYLFIFKHWDRAGYAKFFFIACILYWIFRVASARLSYRLSAIVPTKTVGRKIIIMDLDNNSGVVWNLLFLR